MQHAVSNEDLMRHLDGELSPEERSGLDRHLATCTECGRELALFRELKVELQRLGLRASDPRRSVWDAVHRRVTRSAGWILLLAGGAAWAAYGAYLLVAARVDLWEKLAAGAVGIGILLLLASVIWDRYREWQTDPYRDIQR
ncbi:MAG: zf-HC2 domain-containing protein [Gemmatimonadetes bacterium]|nr:zf-HC2 domain-containing protein [Gemmatimonadota bacterium]